MKKKLIGRGLLGFPLGIAMGYLITILISLSNANGEYFAVMPELERTVGSEINAVALQAALCGLLGAGFAMASVIWELDSWSLARQSAVYFAVISAVMLPIAYIANWMEHSLKGFIVYFGIFAAVFVVIWLVRYLVWRRRVRMMNGRIQGSGSE